MPDPIGTPRNGAVMTTLEIREQYNDNISQVAALVEDLLQRAENSQNRQNNHIEDLERIVQSQRTQLKELERQSQSQQNQLKLVHEVLDEEPFILVLIDGNGLAFADKYVAGGETGGKAAALAVYTDIHKYCHEVIPFLPPATKIVARVYGNLKGLGDLCLRAGIANHASIAHDFARGFSTAKVTFDYTDVGSNSEGAVVNKMLESVSRHMNDYHCRHIVFGCTHARGYARHLQDLTVKNPKATRRVTLVKGPAVEKELQDLEYPKLDLGSIFRATRIRPALNGGAPAFEPTTRHPSPASSDATASPTGFIPWAQRAQQQRPAVAGEGGWAAVVGRAAALPLAPAPPKAPEIWRNRYGQRLDPPLKVQHDKDEVARVRRSKMCINYYLKKECHFVNNCEYDHKAKPTAIDLEYLKLATYYYPCSFGSGCDDPKCIYGHSCHAPPARDPTFIAKNKASGKTCIFGDECNFPPEQHNVDQHKVIKVT